jgi:hypothetical protein
MDRAIFDLEASVEATSLYILLSALSDQGVVLNLKTARFRWNGSEEELFNGADELVKRGVLEATLPLSEETPLHIAPSTEWRRA